MVVLEVVQVPTVTAVVLKFKLVNQATVEYTDLEVMVVMAMLDFLVIRLAAVPVPVQLERLEIVLVVLEQVEQEKIIVQILEAKEIQAGSAAAEVLAM